MDKHNESAKANTPQQGVIVLGVASVETQGAVGSSEGISPGSPMISGISEE
ncbi:benenodin family lasso peptide [Pseudoxanthomonas sp.]|uniref:benenodin family lasso peptide n=1 Tax=Pseudoxanthomonas sp. TaxID=1871049 RepID=UPI002613F902|nr:benenodin family lasso peptide [Pseudoxanthomonas sp.]WDS34745.1 MAG: benenodin family lasso peptide [Pseudoxanthomonas sp.]